MSEFFTSITSTDVEALTYVLESASEGLETIKVCELGIFGGATSRGIKDWCDKRNVLLEFWCVDDSSHSGFVMEGSKAGAPFPGANFVAGKTYDVAHELPDDFDVIFVDAEHSFNGVILDVANYHDKLAPKGFLVFHDCSPVIQGTMREQNRPDIFKFRNCVNHALGVIGWPWEGFTLFLDRYDPEATYGGIRAYRRT